MAFASPSNSALSSEINVTPLIDVLLVLLIIFMVVAPNLSRGLDTSIPRNQPSASQQSQPVVVRLLSGDPHRPVRYSVGQEELAYAALQPRLRSLFALRQDRTLFIEADRSLSYQQVAEVAGEARRAGAGSIALTGPRR
jgi:biopolymer transport protein TolR